MNETPEQKAAREAAERRYFIRQLVAGALPGVIAHYKPETYEPPKEGETAGDELNKVPQLSSGQITEIGLVAYEIAEAALQAIELGEQAIADQKAAESNS